ncbi:MAG: hypothetical protein WBB25_15755 [Sulfitobacter sp.]
MTFLLYAIPGLKASIRRRRDEHRLREMPDYLLHDIGLIRDRTTGAVRPTTFRY